MFPFRLLRALALVLIAAVGCNATAYAAGPALTSVTAKEKVVKRGPGHGVKLVRKDGVEIKGNIVAIGEETVDVMPKGSAGAVTVRFDEIAAVKGPGLSTGAKVGIGIGIGVVVSAGIVALVVKHELDKPWNLTF